VGRVHTLDPDTTTIGRVPGNTIVVNDEFCSAQHARIRIEPGPDGEPAVVLYDMGSRNFTFVGDRETYKDEESRIYRHELQDGDFVLIGDTTLVFKMV
jgi:pSer/pThr/pTyr-binding forkhead associated (FHA) protein